MMLWTAPPPGRANASESVADAGNHDPEELIMQAIATVGLDIAKSVFQVHGLDARGSVVVRRQLKRQYVLRFSRRPLIRAARGERDRVLLSVAYGGWLRVSELVALT